MTVFVFAVSDSDKKIVTKRDRKTKGDIKNAPKKIKLVPLKNRLKSNSVNNLIVFIPFSKFVLKLFTNGKLWLHIYNLPYNSSIFIFGVNSTCIYT